MGLANRQALTFLLEKLIGPSKSTNKTLTLVLLGSVCSLHTLHTVTTYTRKGRLLDIVLFLFVYFFSPALIINQNSPRDSP